MNFMQAVEQCFLGKKCCTDSAVHYYMVFQNNKLVWLRKLDDSRYDDVFCANWAKQNGDNKQVFEFYDPQPKITEFEIGVIYKRKDCQVYNSIIQLDDNNYMVLNTDDLTYWHGTKKEVLAHLNDGKFIKKQS